MECQSIWPELPYLAWKDTCTTLQLWTQIIGKIRLVQTPWLNHSWHTTLYLTARGLTTSPIAYRKRRFFQIDFDFIDHVLLIHVDDGAKGTVPLEPQSVAAFEAAVFAALNKLGLEVSINNQPNEIPNPTPFNKDTVHDAYNSDYAQRFWRVLLQADRVFKHFRTGFLGKASPVHFFWGSFDLAVTRFSGRRAPPHPGNVPGLPDSVCREAYSHEVSSAGFWPGGGPTDYAAFYSYAYPTPEAFSRQPIDPAEAFFDEGAGEFILPYDAVRTAADPDRTLLDFLQTTYKAAAETAGWDRERLECAFGVAGQPRAYEARDE
ncbi:MAG TPA: DUF5996 family protein [Oleiagrimonas sp.]|nr:DUF5996 family protein [Oleiagrimonas sp.]